jgi:D-galactarolactone cycloisomerase
MLGGDNPSIPVYASGLNPHDAEPVALARQAEGYRAFKLKVGFGAERDVANLRGLRAALGADAALMVDANQGWDLATALAVAPELAAFGPAWLEEPLRADRDWEEWRELARRVPIPLAAGENVIGTDGFAAAINAGALAVLQPDLGKWGGISGCAAVARAALRTGLRYCPHWLGGGVGLLASAHLLAAVGGDGLLEIDANENPLRTLTWGPLGRVTDGRVTLSDAPGLGALPDLDVLRPYLVPH